MKAVSIAIIIALCSPAAADWRDEAKDAVTQCADCAGGESRAQAWTLVLYAGQYSVTAMTTISGFRDDVGCQEGGRSLARAAHASVPTEKFRYDCLLVTGAD
jgi:hypothetical protein